MIVGLFIVTGEMIVCVGDPVEGNETDSNISQKVTMAFCPTLFFSHGLVHGQHPLPQDVYSNAYKIDRFHDWDFFTPS